MTDAIAHRGPDAAGAWFDPGPGIWLGHRRLSIIDLSPAGSQPMESTSGQLVIVFNGEIYNHQELRQELDGAKTRSWRGHSDTEVLLASLEEWGIEGALRRVVGMFAFALWNRAERTLTLARDRIGEKPLYYGKAGRAFVFASELKALRAHPAFDGSIDRDALALLLRYNYIPSPYCIYAGVRKLEPGTYLTVRADRTAGSPKPYWSLRSAGEAGQVEPFRGDDRQAIGELERLLRQAIRQQMVADVPLGAFLSGGIDSSSVVALMQAESSTPVRTFTIGFHEDEYNEAEHAKRVARHLRTDHTELYVTPQETRDVIPRLPVLYDEPFADSSQIPTFLVSQMARRDVTVSLSGDGGDELFAGYRRHVLTSRLWGALARTPLVLRRAVAAAILTTPAGKLDRGLRVLGGALPRAARAQLNGDRLRKGATVLTSASVAEVYRRIVTHWADPTAVVIGAREPLTVLSDPSLQPQLDGPIERMMALDTLTYLPDDILVKVDRAAMGVSLETRIPFLDHRVVEFACRLPLGFKLRGGVGKWVLRQVLSQYVPPSLTDRPKQGFGIPVGEWLRGPLREWAEDLLDERRLREDGYLRPEPIRKKWDQHQSLATNAQYSLWGVLMFQAWRAAQRDAATAQVTSSGVQDDRRPMGPRGGDSGRGMFADD
jgi:asparagine synthase (glutamine-hydrolysing)